MIHLNVLLGTFVVAIGLWLLWDSLPLVVLVGWILALGGFLWWKARTLTEVWAWSTLVLGIESFAWPLILLVQMRSSGVPPTEDQMGTVLSAVVMGLFSSVFWLSLSYGLFKRAWSPAPAPSSQVRDSQSQAKSKRTR